MTSTFPLTIPPATRNILDGISQQFALSDARLVKITEHFVSDFNLGLAEYSHAMAMV